MSSDALHSEFLPFSISTPQVFSSTSNDFPTRQVAELHLDERLASSREAINKTLATSSKAVSGAINNLWADIEVMRETQRKKNEAARAAASAPALNPEKAREPLDDAVPPALTRCEREPTSLSTA